MADSSKLRWFRAEDWRLAVMSDDWNQQLSERVIAIVSQSSPSKHPQTIQLRHSDSIDRCFFLKVFHPAKGVARLKDLVRRSKALRALTQGTALAKAGFDVPPTIAAGERRKCGVLYESFALSAEVSGAALPSFLRTGLPLAEKRAALVQLAELVRRLHRQGFVHGDLVASNIFVARAAGGRLRFYFMDNDRTRRYPRWFPQRWWKRNLVQLNRLPLPAVTLQDRLRFFHAYIGGDPRSAKARRLLKWLELKTRRRRKECDAVEPEGSFRKLMSWRDEPRAGN